MYTLEKQHLSALQKVQEDVSSPYFDGVKSVGM